LVAQAGSVLGATSVCVNVTVNGCMVNGCTTVTVNGPSTLTEIATEDWFTVRPNPSDGLFQLIPGGDRTTMNITVYDGTGRTVKASFPVAGKRAVSIDLGDVSPGAYYLLAT